MMPSRRAFRSDMRYYSAYTCACGCDMVARVDDSAAMLLFAHPHGKETMVVYVEGHGPIGAFHAPVWEQP